MKLFSQSKTNIELRRDKDGFLPLELYGPIGDGRSVALCGADGSIDWWCVPNIDSPPLFDRVLNGAHGGYFSITPKEPFSMVRQYVQRSNVLETIFTTDSGTARLLESHNSGSAGRLPWAELARRIEGVSGEVEFEIKVRFSLRSNKISPYGSRIGKHDVFHADSVLGVCLRSDHVMLIHSDDSGLDAVVTVAAGQKEMFAIVAGEDEPLIVPSIADIDARLDSSTLAWQEWTNGVQFRGPERELLLRSALALKLLLFSPSGAIAAAATTSLPEKIGRDKNYDYRFAWIRDAGYTIRAFLQIHAQAEAKAAFTWLLRQVEDAQARVMYALEGGPARPPETVDLDGYKNSVPVRVGNIATDQFQLGIFGDIFETAASFVDSGNILDAHSARTLSRLADQCADQWRKKDAGIWELTEPQHYTMSKISAWQALARAVELAEEGQLPTTCQERWARERDRIAAWITENCWSESRGAYVLYAGSTQLDASIALAARFGFGGKERLTRTLDAIEHELGKNGFHYRYSGADAEEGCFLACTFWIAEARVLLGQHAHAMDVFGAALERLQGNIGVYSEMIDPDTFTFLGNLPQGLTHLAIIQAICALESKK